MQKRRFITADEGAVTIDWVALAAGLLILGVAIVGLLTNELQSVIDEVEAQLTAATSVEAPVENGASGDDGGNVIAYGTGATDPYSGEPVVAAEGDYWLDMNSDGEPNAGDNFLVVADNMTDWDHDRGYISGTIVFGNGASDGGSGDAYGASYYDVGSWGYQRL